MSMEILNATVIRYNAPYRKQRYNVANRVTIHLGGEDRYDVETSGLQSMIAISIRLVSRYYTCIVNWAGEIDMRSWDKLNRICKCVPITAALAPSCITRCNLQPTFCVLMLSRVWFHLISVALDACTVWSTSNGVKDLLLYGGTFTI